jgi:hypothetical protein
MAKTIKMSKMASKDGPQPTALGTEGSIHINLDQEIVTGYKKGIQGHLLLTSEGSICDRNGYSCRCQRARADVRILKDNSEPQA